MRRPQAYMGFCGPGTLVVTVCTLRWLTRAKRRPPRARSSGGAKPASEVSASAATACFFSLSPSICSRIDSRRLRGSSMPTGSSANMAETRLFNVPRSSSLRTETGTSVRTTRPSTSSPR